MLVIIRASKIREIHWKVMWKPHEYEGCILNSGEPKGKWHGNPCIAMSRI